MSVFSVHKSDAHLYIENVLPVLLKLAGKGIRVYLMHLDNEEEIMRRIQGTSLRIAPLYRNK
jgi:hypothetical protein